MITRQPTPETIALPLVQRAVQQALNIGSFQSLAWTWQSLYTPLVSTTHGVYLLTGTVVQNGHEHPWRLVLKLLAPSSVQEMPLEAALYASGFLASLQGDLRAPHCYGVDSLPDGSTALWLEYLTEIRQHWTLQDFRHTAHRLGLFTATYTSHDLLVDPHSIPRFTWRVLRDTWYENLVELQAVAEHPVVQRAYPAETITAFLQLWAIHEALFVILEQMPQVLCHGDAQRRNLFMQETDPLSTQTLAIDWANVSLRPIGNDITTLLHQSVLYFALDTVNMELYEHVFVKAFVDGLAAGGRTLQEDVVAYAVAVQLCLGCGLSQLRPFLRFALNPDRKPWAERFYGQPFETIVERHYAISSYIQTRVQAVVDALPSYL